MKVIGYKSKLVYTLYAPAYRQRITFSSGIARVRHMPKGYSPPRVGATEEFQVDRKIYRKFVDEAKRFSEAYDDFAGVVGNFFGSLETTESQQRLKRLKAYLRGSATKKAS